MTDSARTAPDARSPRPRVLVVGAGFGGLNVARRLRRADVDVVVVDRTNHHLFQPLLYQVATATLSPSDIAVPIRWILRRNPRATVLLGEVERVDLAGRCVRLVDGTSLDWDYLVLATGARHSYFGNDGWERLAPGLKSLEDALEIRRRFLLSFERAERAEDAAERRALQTFVVVGAGPTGVELAGILPTIAREAFRSDFRRIDTRDTRVVLVEGGPRVLAAFPQDLSDRALRDLERLRVEVRLDSVVTRVDADAVCIGDERIPTRNVFWAAGNTASPLVRQLGAETDRAGRAKVSADLSLPGHPNVFVIGDAAAVTSTNGRPVPGVAPAATQMGKHAADNIRRDLDGEAREAFRYLNKGDLATIGRHKAVASFGGRLRFGGTIAWLLWLFVHIMYLVGFRNRASVLLSWMYSYFTYQRGVRLITGREGTAAAMNPPPGSGPGVGPGW